jgi:type I site-specific restriction endonuclease
MAKPGRPRRSEEKRTMPSDENTGMMYIDPSLLNSDEWHYAFVEMEVLGQETQSIERATMKGYTPVLKGDVPGYANSMALVDKIRGRDSANDFIRKGGQILMRCPIELYHKRMREQRSLNKEHMSRVDWADSSGKVGAPTFVERSDYTRTNEKVFAPDDGDEE